MDIYRSRLLVQEPGAPSILSTGPRSDPAARTWSAHLARLAVLPLSITATALFLSSGHAAAAGLGGSGIAPTQPSLPAPVAVSPSGQTAPAVTGASQVSASISTRPVVSAQGAGSAPVPAAGTVSTRVN